jgi:hypothetical protein
VLDGRLTVQAAALRAGCHWRTIARHVETDARSRDKPKKEEKADIARATNARKKKSDQVATPE